MKRGTTPTHKFVLPFSVDMVEDAEVTYCQNRKEVLRKQATDCSMDGNTIQLKLTQDETFLFAENTNVEIQLRVLTKGKDCLASDVFTVSCSRCLSCEVL